MPLPENWRAFIESLNSHGVEYLVLRDDRVYALPFLLHPGIPDLEYYVNCP